ncbi:helix-turn-helix domain-containing protein [Halomonas sp. TBZ9]|uniref:Helix-turn-helix domain-containing protein n=1 Tax=Vreelandella azerica TaxID=2732867 RepID=A0A7Y3XBZ2_9GAMM|nr:helix-turn-helix domain-containing protein [Halomonas azerica]NOG32849.1 helix-turn-helix domain-containing protein [Halomonas azerica]
MHQSLLVTLGELMSRSGERPVHRNTVRKAIQKLEAERWIEIVPIGGKGSALAYVINDRVAWGQPRDNLRYSRFSAQVLASPNEQATPLDDRPPLRQIPTLMRGEKQIPHGEHGEPPSQGLIPGFEPDLPMRNDDGEDNY